MTIAMMMAAATSRAATAMMANAHDGRVADVESLLDSPASMVGTAVLIGMGDGVGQEAPTQMVHSGPPRFGLSVKDVTKTSTGPERPAFLMLTADVVPATTTASWGPFRYADDGAMLDEPAVRICAYTTAPVVLLNLRRAWFATRMRACARD